MVLVSTEDMGGVTLAGSGVCGWCSGGVRDCLIGGHCLEEEEVLLPRLLSRGDGDLPVQDQLVRSCKYTTVVTLVRKLS